MFLRVCMRALPVVAPGQVVAFLIMTSITLRSKISGESSTAVGRAQAVVRDLDGRLVCLVEGHAE